MKPLNHRPSTLRSRPRSVRSGLALVAAVLAAVASVPESAAAQLRIAPQLGVYLPVSDMGRFTGPDAEDAIEVGRAESSLAYGLSVEVGPRGPIAFRGAVHYATASDVPFTDVGCPNGCPRSTLLAGSAGVVVGAAVPVIRPYVMAGLAAKRYGFDFDEGIPRVLEDQDHIGAQVGAGLAAALGGFNLSLEISNYISRLEGIDDQRGNRQHDFFLTLGAVFGR